MIRLTSVLMLMLAAMIFAVGCSNTDTPSEPAATDNTNLTDEFGGYTASAEAPAFGDTELLAAEGEEVAVNDELESSPDVATLADDPEADLFCIRAVWGQLRYDSTHVDATDWTGSFTASSGALLIRRLIRFELNQDGYFPRDQREVVEWFSTTTTHNDGIEIEFLVPPQFVVDTTAVVDSLGDTVYVYDTLPADPVTLAFETAPYSQTFSLEELAALDTIIELEDGNAVLLQAFERPRVGCRKGLAAGHWGYDEHGNGIFQGHWMGARGITAGHLRGHFGVDEFGNNMFYGKWINLNGSFEGFVRGTYTPHPNQHANDMARLRSGGFLEGQILDADGNEIGLVRGKYNSAPNWPAGHFQLRWKLHCNEISTSNTLWDYDDGMD